MARITVEDCIDKFPSRFELVLVASNRARKLHSGETPSVEKDNDKNTVIALREIAQETISSERLQNDLVEEYQVTSLLDDDQSIDSENDEKNDVDENLIENIYSDETESNETTDGDNNQSTENTATKNLDENHQDIDESESQDKEN
tara:strand:+ start:499 stop:936 length:438 start_codon:yes stop_codon:yes gene_type:complete